MNLYTDELEFFDKELLIEHFTKKKTNPLSKQQAIKYLNNLEASYRQRLNKIKECEFSNKELILKQLLEQLSQFERDYEVYGENIYKEYETEKFEQIWFYSKILEELKELNENINTKDLFIKCNNKFFDLFVNFYFYTKENKIYADSILGTSSINIHDTTWKKEIGLEIKEYELKENDDYYIEISKSEAEVLEDFFMKDINLIYSQNIKKALDYAIFYFTGKKRKILDKPYLSHALETMLIASSLTSNENVLISALLHGVVKNSDSNIIEIKKYFGMNIAEKILFMTNMEENFNNEKDWSEGKKNILYKLDNANIEIKILVLSNELSKLREIDKDFETYKDKVWSYFNEPDKNKHKWYHEEVLERLYPLRLSGAYDEYKELIYKNLTNIYN
ncbi:HD domain-containing protein [Anaerofustis butyriciformans]|uniref:HD domain-containing protein n=1 Tax=Anaerofustis TaxID=264995 RepID=UPI003F8A6411